MHVFEAVGNSSKAWPGFHLNLFSEGKVSWEMKTSSSAGSLPCWSSWFVRLWGRRPLLHLTLELIRHVLEHQYILWDWTNTFTSPRSPTYEHSASDVSAEDSCFFCSSWTYSCRWSYLMMFWRGSPIQKKLKSNTWKTSYSNFVEFNLSAQKVEIVVICNPYKSVICYLSYLLFVIRNKS